MSVCAAVALVMLTCADIEIAARTVWGEARGESYAAKKAVAHVIINRWRARHRRETTIAGVCLEPMQFSAWNEADPNRDKLMRIGPWSRPFRDSWRAVLAALEEPDPTGGATHYHTASVRPRWARGQQPSAVIGSHKFYAGIK